MNIVSRKNMILLALFLEGLASGSVYFLMVFAASQTMEPWALMAIALASTLSGVLLAAPMGFIVDRLNLRRAWRLGLLIDFLGILIIALVPQLWVWIGVIIIRTGVSILTGAAQFKILPKIEGMTEKTASAYLVGLGSFLGISIPVFASLIYSFFQEQASLLAALVFLPALLILTLAIPQIETKVSLEPLSLKEVFLGLGAISRSQRVLAYLPVMFLAVLCTSVEDLSGVIYLQEVGGQFISSHLPSYQGQPDALGYSLLVSCWSLGTLLMAFISARPFYRVKGLPALLWGGLGIALAILGEGLFSYAPLIALVFLAGGLCNSMHNLGIRQMVYDYVPEENQGQVWAMIGASFQIFVSLGQVLGTPYLLAEPRTVIIAGGGLAATLILLFLLLSPFLEGRFKNKS